MEHKTECQKLETCEDGMFQQEAREVVGEWLFALTRRWGVGGMSGSRPLRSPLSKLCPKWRLAVGVGAHGVGNVKGNEGNDDRRSPRRSWCGSTTQLQRDRRTRVVGGRRGHGD